MTRLIKAEIFKLRKRSMTYILLLILIGFIVLVLSISQATAMNSTTAVTIDGNGVTSTTVVPVVAADIHFLKDMITGVISILGTIGMILAVVLVANGMGSEYSWNTIRPYLLCSESRLKMFTAKLIAAAGFIVAGIIIGLVTAVFLGVLFTAIRGFSWDIGSGLASFTGRELLTFVRTLYVMLPYILLAFLFTVFGRSTAAGIGFGIGASVLESIITGLLFMAHGWLAKIPDYLLSTNIQAINALSQSSLRVSIGSNSNTQIPSAPHAFVVLAVYCVVFIAISFTLFQKRDVTG
jgi:ABC-2 type transport system permease protein